MARKILLADDSVTAQNMGRKILADAGYEVITVNNGSAALKKIGEQKPDLIVLDVYMPGYSGLEVCQRLKEVGDTSRIPVLLTVGKLEPFKPEEAKRVRADGYIVKPFEASELLSALSKLEDKIVPRAESSKPGRFARATAAIEEARYDKTVAVEEDSGMEESHRVSVEEEKEKDAGAEADEAAIYNPVNKDLRTVIDHKLAETPGDGKGRQSISAHSRPRVCRRTSHRKKLQRWQQQPRRFKERSQNSRGAERAPDTVPTPSAIETTKLESRQEVRSGIPSKKLRQVLPLSRNIRPTNRRSRTWLRPLLPSSVPNSGNGSGRMSHLLHPMNL